MAENKPEDRQTAAAARQARSDAREAIADANKPADVPPPGDATLEAAANMATHPEALSPEEETRRREAEARAAEEKLTPAQRRARERQASQRAGEDPRVARAATALVHAAGATPMAPETFPELNPPAPGETERGWSPEVTARHPQVLAENMARVAEMSGHAVGPRKAAKIESIDPTDPLAVTAALREQGFHEQRMIDLRNKAILLGFEDLAAAEDARAVASPHTARALNEAIGTAQDQARAVGHDID